MCDFPSNIEVLENHSVQNSPIGEGGGSICSSWSNMNRLLFFSKSRYMIGVGFKILARTPVPKLPPSYPSPLARIKN